MQRYTNANANVRRPRHAHAILDRGGAIPIPKLKNDISHLIPRVTTLAPLRVGNTRVEPLERIHIAIDIGSSWRRSQALRPDDPVPVRSVQD